MRGRRSATLGLKSDTGAAAALELVAKADALIEDFRPGVLERLVSARKCCSRAILSSSWAG
jgi:alpha-methylacyl-CoA racemase